MVKEKSGEPNILVFFLVNGTTFILCPTLQLTYTNLIQISNKE